MNSTETAYCELKKAYDFFNDKLFDGVLGDCLITFQRINGCYGYYYPKRFNSKNKESVGEIALNPSFFSTYPITEILQTLAHEMVHLWQEHFGKKGRRGYHNKEWGDFMEQIGLMPSNTGAEGGKRTGDQMADYIISGGLFEVVVQELLGDGFDVTWADSVPDKAAVKSAIRTEGLDVVKEALSKWHIEEKVQSSGELDVKKPTRVKFTCPSCNSNLWGKPTLNVICADCDVPYTGNQ